MEEKNISSSEEHDSFILLISKSHLPSKLRQLLIEKCIEYALSAPSNEQNFEIYQEIESDYAINAFAKALTSKYFDRETLTSFYTKVIGEEGLKDLIKKFKNSTVFSTLQMLLGIEKNLLLYSLFCNLLDGRSLDSQEQVAHLLNQLSHTSSKIIIEKCFEYDLRNNGPTLFESYQRVENMFLEANSCYQVRKCFQNVILTLQTYAEEVEEEKIGGNCIQFLSKLPFLNHDYSYPALPPS